MLEPNDTTPSSARKPPPRSLFRWWCDPRHSWLRVRAFAPLGLGRSLPLCGDRADEYEPLVSPSVLFWTS